MLFVYILFVVAGAFEYPQQKRGGDVCICGGRSTGVQSECERVALRLRPYDGTLRSPVFYDVPPTASTVSAAAIQTVQAGHPLPRILLEVVSEKEQLEAEAFSLDESPGLLAVALMNMLNESSIRLVSLTVSEVSDPAITVQVISGTAKVQNGRVLLDAVQLIPSGLLGGQAVTVILNVTLEVDFSFARNGANRLWMLIPAVDIRTSALVGNLSFSVYPRLLRFPHVGSPFTTAFSPLSVFRDISTITLDSPLPPITVVIVNVFNTLTADDGLQIELSIYYETGVKVTSVEGDIVSTIRNGSATFYGVTLTNKTTPRISVTFVFTAADSTVSPLSRAGLLTLPVPTYNAQIRFAPDSSFGEQVVPSLEVTGPITTSLTALVGVPLPRVEVQILDSSGAIDTISSEGFFVFADSAEAVLETTGSWAPVRSGVAVFSNITFQRVQTGRNSPQTVSLLFRTSDTPRPFSSAAAFRKAIFSPQIFLHRNPLSEPTSLKLVERDDSFLSKSQNLLKQRENFSVIIGVLSEDNSYSRITGMKVVILALGGTVAGTSEAAVENGVAEFRDISVVSPLTCSRLNATSCEIKLLFRLVGSPTPVSELVHSVFAYSGDSLAPFRIRFEPTSSSLFSREGQVAFATARVVLPPVVIEVLGPDGKVDIDANDITVVASTASLALEGNTAVSFRGRVLFSGLLFAEEGNDILTFSVSSERTSGFLAGKSLRTGNIVVEGTPTPEYGLRFHANSAIDGSMSGMLASRGFALPRIGVQVYGSDHTPSNSSNMIQIEATTKDRFSLSSTTTVTVIAGVAWFENLVFDVSAVLMSPSVSFRARIMQSTTPLLPFAFPIRDSMGRIEGFQLVTGNIFFVDPSRPTRLALAPFIENGLIVRSLDSRTQQPISSVGESLSIFKTGVLAESTVLEASVLLESSASRITLPSQETNVFLYSNTLSVEGPTNSTFTADSRPASTPTKIRANFSNVQFSQFSNAYISSFFSSVTFSFSHESGIFVQPVRVGNVVYKGSSPAGDVDEPVLLVEVLLAGASFSLEAWVDDLSLLLNIPKVRIEILRVRRGSSATTAFDRLWTGTRLELRFLSPTPSTLRKTASRELALNFLSLSPGDCGPVSTLRIRRKLFLSDDTECDLYELDEHRRAAHRCVATSGPADRCICHEPVFELLGERCKSTSQMLSMCTTLNRCGNYPLIAEPCFQLTYLIYVQYALIGLYALIAVLAAYIIYLWRSGAFARCLRRRLNDAVDKKAEPLITADADYEVDHMDIIV